MYYNHTLLAGRIATQPEVKEVGERRVSSFRMAVNAFWRGKEGESKQNTQFFTVTTWNGLADKVGEYGVGDAIFVEGRLRENVWQDKEGENRRSVEVVAQKVRMVKRKNVNTDAILKNAIKQPVEAK